MDDKVIDGYIELELDIFHDFVIDFLRNIQGYCMVSRGDMNHVHSLIMNILCYTLALYFKNRKYTDSRIDEIAPIFIKTAKMILLQLYAADEQNGEVDEVK